MKWGSEVRYSEEIWKLGMWSWGDGILYCKMEIFKGMRVDRRDFLIGEVRRMIKGK